MNRHVACEHVGVVGKVCDKSGLSGGVDRNQHVT